MNMKAKRIHNKKNAAQAMVEFALILPILLLLIYGIIEIGRVIFIYSSVVTSARSATRYGSTTGLVDNVGTTLRYQDCAGMRAAARRSAFIDALLDNDIVIQHDKGEGVSVEDYCTPGDAVDTSFEPSAGNIDRVRVTVSTQYAPIVPIVPIGPFTISSTSARTVLVSVPIAITAAPLGWNAPTNTTAPTIPPSPVDTDIPDTPTSTPTNFTPSATVSPTITLTPSKTLTPTKTGTPTNTGTATQTPSPTGTAFSCVVKHSALKSDPTYSMTVFNDSAADTIHVASIQIYFQNNTPNGQALIGVSFGGVSIWTGSLTGSPAVVSAFIGDISVSAGSSKLILLSFEKNYNDDGNEKILITFSEASCPTLDSSNASQLK